MDSPSAPNPAKNPKHTLDLSWAQDGPDMLSPYKVSPNLAETSPPHVYMVASLIDTIFVSFHLANLPIIPVPSVFIAERPEHRTYYTHVHNS